MAKHPKLPTLSASLLDPATVCPPCGKCCRYVAVGIDGPVSVSGVSTALWLVYHKNVSVYQSHDGDWFVLFPAACDNLLPNGLCGVYDNRPFLCREYDIDGCEGTSDEAPEKLRFDDGPLARNLAPEDASGPLRPLSRGRDPPGTASWTVVRPGAAPAFARPVRRPYASRLRRSPSSSPPSW